MIVKPEIGDKEVEAFATEYQRLHEALNEVIVGQQPVISQLLIAILAGGHVLLEGMPGLGKTHLAKSLAGATGLPFSRIQSTPDLMPSDITGSEVLIDDHETGARNFEFREGPIFSSFVLVDEINRASPKTQAALLEAMQETQVTFAGKRHPLPKPFWVVATQNAIELEGTYILPEAQLDRFIAKIVIEYPNREALQALIDTSLDEEPTDRMDVVVPAELIEEMMRNATGVIMSRHVREAAIELVLATHPGNDTPLASLGHHFKYGASPRAIQALLKMARVHAIAKCRAHVGIVDIAAIALPALQHRVCLTIESELDNIRIDQALQELVSAWQEKWT
jgi:MoxR-like ATPase